MKYLTMVGGGDTGETVRRMMRKVGTNNVWSQYNMVGRGGKRSFKATTVFKVIMKATMKNSKENEKMIEQAMAGFLKATPFKKGGQIYGKKTEQEESSSEHERTEQDPDDDEDEDEDDAADRAAPEDLKN
ncbi:uncharacterized protein [Amphiura filiformis]|uniref:uncharacterized protein n=1 Tax=Amphiura filiformis TaxID=82378 RepID=UPI003B21B461